MPVSPDLYLPIFKNYPDKINCLSEKKTRDITMGLVFKKCGKIYGYSISLSVLSASSFMRADILLEEE